MLQAWIVSREESVYFTAPARPESLASMRRHIQSMQRRQHGRLHVALRLDGFGMGTGSVEVAALLRQLVVAGVQPTLATAVESSETLRPPVAGAENSPRGGVLGRRWGSSGHAANHVAHALGGGDAIARRP